MKALMTAIYGRFTETTGALHNSLYLALAGQLHNTVAPQSTAYPYGIFMLVANAPDWMFGTDENFDDVLIQFSFFDTARSPANIMTTGQYCRDLYHWRPLTVTGYTFHSMYLENEQLMKGEDDTVWHYLMEYRVMLEKTS